MSEHYPSGHCLDTLLNAQEPTDSQFSISSPSNRGGSFQPSGSLDFWTSYFNVGGNESVNGSVNGSEQDSSSVDNLIQLRALPATS